MTASWSGEEWQGYCRELLAVRHGADYQPVPDTVSGDWGVEGFTSTGLLYQCYAPEEPLSTKQLYEKHRDKMTADLAKMCDHVADLRNLINPSEIGCWVLLVPRVEDKEILKHAAKKAQEVRAKSLGGVSAAFIIRVHTAEDFPSECRQLDEAIALEIPPVALAPDDITAFAEDPNIPLENLDRKLTKLAPTFGEAGIQELRGEFIKLYLVGSQLDGWVRRHHPSLWERWQHSREGVKRTLKVLEMVGSDPPPKRLGGIVASLEGAASSAVPSIMVPDATSLAWGTIADWLIECPLDFAEDGVGS